MQTTVQTVGKAYLVGAGPGRADLITVRGLRLLQRADVVVYDRLVARELLDEVGPGAELIFVGKGPGLHVKSQHEIGQILVSRVAAGLQVVRLKGGDPFVFGRGGEEILTLRLAGLPYEVVPGVTSALAVPAYAGVPVTHRGSASAFAVVTGQTGANADEKAVDWAAMAAVPTLIVLMGVSQIGRICHALLAAGRAATTPAIAIRDGTTDRQQVVRACLADLPAVMAAQGLAAPAVIVIGEVAALHDDLAWFQPDGGAEGFFSLDETAAAQEPNPHALSHCAD